MLRKSREYYLNQILNRNSEILYEKHPHGSLSVGEDEMCLAFRGYLEEWLLPNESLDVGCGPQYKPSYIPRDDYSAKITLHNPLGIAKSYKWTGLDPLPSQEVCRIADDWFGRRIVREIEDYSAIKHYRFANVVFATSLDHCYDPAKAIMNVHKRLDQGGRLIIWTMIRPGLRTRLVWWKELWKRRRIEFHYDIPFYAPLGCPDPFHRRYLTLKQIERWASGGFKLLNYQQQKNRNIFLCFEKL